MVGKRGKLLTRCCGEGGNEEGGGVHEGAKRNGGLL